MAPVLKILGVPRLLQGGSLGTGKQGTVPNFGVPCRFFSTCKWSYRVQIFAVDKTQMTSLLTINKGVQGNKFARKNALDAKRYVGSQVFISPFQTELTASRFSLILTMACISVTFCWSLVIFYVLVKTQALPTYRLVNSTSTPIGTQNCNNAMLKEIKEQLGQLQTDINILKGNKSNENGMSSF